MCFSPKASLLLGRVLWFLPTALAPAGSRVWSSAVEGRGHQTGSHPGSGFHGLRLPRGSCGSSSNLRLCFCSHKMGRRRSFPTVIVEMDDTPTDEGAGRSPGVPPPSSPLSGLPSVCQPFLWKLPRFLPVLLLQPTESRPGRVQAPHQPLEVALSLLQGCICSCGIGIEMTSVRLSSVTHQPQEEQNPLSFSCHIHKMGPAS